MMECYRFYEAASLLSFIEENRKAFIGHVLIYSSVYFWHAGFDGEFIDEPLILESDNGFADIDFRYPSEMTLIVGTKDEFLRDRKYEKILRNRKPISAYIGTKSYGGPATDCAEDYTLVDIGIERFSNAFECDPSSGAIRPAGGDYFSKIILTFRNGRKLYIQGSDASNDGYAEIWIDGLPEKLTAG